MGLPQRVKIGRDVAGLLFVKWHVRHSRLRSQRWGLPDPADKYGWLVRQNAGDELPSSEFLERRPDNPVCPGYTGDRVADAALHLGDDGASGLGVAGNDALAGRNIHIVARA